MTGAYQPQNPVQLITPYFFKIPSPCYYLNAMVRLAGLLLHILEVLSSKHSFETSYLCSGCPVPVCTCQTNTSH